MASCHTVTFNETSKIIHTTDCVNGSIIPNLTLKSSSTFTYLEKLHRNEHFMNRKIAPFEADLSIASDAQLLINYEGCVNLLQNECQEFFHDLGRCGSDYNAPSRFPCFYSKNNSSFAYYVS